MLLILSLMTVPLMLGLVLVSALLQAVALPEWFLGLVPAVNYALTEIVVRFGGELTSTQKQNLSLAVAIALFTALGVFGGIDVPGAAPDAPLIGLWVPYLLGLFAWLWKGSQVVHDVLDVFKPSEPEPS